ncbi:iron-siderophore ABC transporter substrate-binding protein [Martelella lutilitoris]|uniref:Iron-siderophore ABC transporter substrate-binding protein n=1 Tax=Martelella lutilitoris TaxID=2583532 RepID=A0A7T7HNL3_9HYPH|nr:iron-siderophore ABC transporter substrate-binding protein [Martelella lutilitoris]QQM32444.1 iron-siderophore ABC transporter substrate-binding protein [Martelella lutilitoris]
MPSLTKLAALAAFAIGLCSTPLSARDVKDAMGTVTVPDDPQRVVVLTNEGTEAALALGVRPVGAVNSWRGDPWWNHIDDQMGAAVPVGTESAVNLEMIAALEPDLILANRQRQEEVYPQLSAIAPTVMSGELRGDWKVNFRLYADALGLADKGAAEIAAYDEAAADLRDRLGDAVDEKVSVIRFLPGQIRIYQLDSFSGVLLKDIGFDRPENQNVDAFAIRTGKESIPDMDGDRIFYFTWETGNGEGEAMEKDVLGDPLWQSLSAVRAGRAHAVSDAVWNTAGGIIAARLMLADIARIYGVQ